MFVKVDIRKQYDAISRSKNGHVGLGTYLLTGPLFNNYHFVNYAAIWVTTSEAYSKVNIKTGRQQLF